MNGLIAGAIYALVACGFSLVYSTVKFMHFAHGGVLVFGAYAIYSLFALAGINFPVAALVTVILTGFFGVLINLVVYKPLRSRKAGAVGMLIASLALFIFTENLALLLFGADVKTLNLIRIAEGITIGGVIITKLQIVIIAVSTALLVFFGLFMKKTRLGKAMRAVADNRVVAETVGISAEKIYHYAFFIASAVAGVASILISLEQNIEPTMGLQLILKGFAGAIIGGVESVSGAVLGSFLLGVVENLGILYLLSGYKDGIAFALLFLFLIFRPQGILGMRKRSA